MDEAVHGNMIMAHYSCSETASVNDMLHVVTRSPADVIVVTLEISGANYRRNCEKAHTLSTCGAKGSQSRDSDISGHVQDLMHEKM